MHIFSVNQDTNPQNQMQKSRRTGAVKSASAERSVDVMDDGRKKIWICLLVVALAAVVIGILYYFSTPAEHGSEGFLIRAEVEEDAL